MNLTFDSIRFINDSWFEEVLITRDKLFSLTITKSASEFVSESGNNLYLLYSFALEIVSLDFVSLCKRLVIYP